MKRAVFEIKQNAVGRYYFVFKDSNGQTLFASGSFPRRSELEKQLAIVRETSPIAQVCDDSAVPVPPCFLLRESSGGFSFSLIGFNGENIFDSTTYRERNICIKAIESIKTESLVAGIIDLIDDDKA